MKYPTLQKVLATASDLTILFNRELEEYRVPAPSGKESGAYYTSDLEDAKDTLISSWAAAGIEVNPAEIKVKRVSEWPKNRGGEATSTASQGLSPDQERALGHLIDAASLTHVLMSLAKLCQAKVQSDQARAEAWTASGQVIDRASDETDQLGT